MFMPLELTFKLDDLDKSVGSSAIKSTLFPPIKLPPPSKSGGYTETPKLDVCSMPSWLSLIKILPALALSKVKFSVRVFSPCFIKSSKIASLPVKTSCFPVKALVTI